MLMRSLTLLLVLAGAAHADTRRLTVEDALAEALHSYPQLVAARARARAGGDNAKSAIGRMLPSVRLLDEYQHWNAPYELPFGGMSFRVRDADTNNFTASAAQPLLGLGRLSEEYLAPRGDAVAGKQTLRAAEDELRAGLRIGFLRFFEAKAMTELALASAGQLDEQVVGHRRQSESGRADHRRISCACARPPTNARQQAIVARTQAAVSRGAGARRRSGCIPTTPSSWWSRWRCSQTSRRRPDANLGPGGGAPAGGGRSARHCRVGRSPHTRRYLGAGSRRRR